MKYFPIAIVLNIIFLNISKAQLHDSTLVKKLSIASVCLCQTTIADLKQKDRDLKEVDVEELDLAKNCVGEDVRFEAGKGFYLPNQPGIIFQKEKDSVFISKIRLTSDFSGKLPDGKQVDLHKMLLKDLFRLYPQYKDKWNSRDCSDYWNFSNDTISFYVKIDKNKLPQFPIDEAYYLNKPVVAIELTASCRAVRAYDAGYQALQGQIEPIFFIDSIRTSKSDLIKIDADSVAIVSVIKDTAQLKKFGQAANGKLIFIETKDFAKKRYWKYFSSKSEDYLKIVPNPYNDLSVQYILNAKVLKKNFEGDLALINDKKFKDIKIIGKAELIRDFKIDDKEYGVIITTNSK